MTTAPGRTLALIGGNVNLNGGDLLVPGGRVELGAVGDNALVQLTGTTTPVGTQWNVGYGAVQQFGSVNLTQRSAVDVSAAGAIGAGSIQVQGRNVNISDGSMLFSGNAGNPAAGKLQIKALESFEISGIGQDGFSSQVNALAFSRGRGGDIAIETQRFAQRDGAVIRASNYGLGSGGNVTVRASDSAVVSGVSAFDRAFGSLLTTGTFSTFGGDLTIDTPRFEVVNGAIVSSASFADGTGGNLTINARQITLRAPDPTVGNSIISTSGFGTKRAGTLRLNVERLEVLEGSTIASAAFNRSFGGNLIINASDSIQISGSKTTSEGLLRSNINSSANEADSILQRFFGVPRFPQGDAGSVVINTPSLTLQDSGRIGAKNDGSGNAGTVEINADRLSLDSGSSILTSTASGKGGNMELNVKEQILLRRGSFLTATAGGNGNGGNIQLNTPFLVAVPGENSDIVAQASQGNGGNIQVNARIYGIEPRSALTPFSDINASSAFGLSGSVTLTDFNVLPSTGLVALPTGLLDSSQKVAMNCAAQGESRFVATRRGGIPENPSQMLATVKAWQDMRAVEGEASLSPKIASQPLEAKAMRVTQDNQVELLAAEPSVAWASCAGGK